MNLEIACTMRSRLLGLFGRPGFDGVLLLVPCHDIHTFGMSRPIDVAFVASDGTVLEAHRGVEPCHRLKNREAAATLERHAAPDPWFEPGDRIQDERIEKPATQNIQENRSGFAQWERFSAPLLLAP